MWLFFSTKILFELFLDFRLSFLIFSHSLCLALAIFVLGVAAALLAYVIVFKPNENEEG
jgi:hypothetical protein